MKHLLRGLALFAGLLAIATAVAWFWPLESHIPAIEKLAGEKLAQPVKIGGLRILLLPQPALHVSNIRVGAKAELTVGKVAVVPALGTLFDQTRVLSEVALKDLTLDPAIAASLAAALGQGKSTGPAPLLVERVSVRNAVVKLPAGPLPPMEADLWLRPDGGLARALARSAEGNLHLEATPDGKDMRLKLEANKWKVPVGLPILFDRLDVAGRLSGEHLALPNIAARLYGGALEGKADLSWGKGWKVSGDAVGKGLSVQPLVALAAPKTRMSGKLDSKARYSSAAKDAGGLADAIRVDGTFAVTDGVLHGLDLAKAAQSLLKGGTKGGETAFDELSGSYKVVGKEYKLSNLNISSGALSGSGDVDIAPSKALGGKIYVELKAGVSLVKVPLKLSGTVAEPVLMPTGAALAGAAVGTGVLGPAGTALGVRAADALDNLFGGSKKK